MFNRRYYNLMNTMETLVPTNALLINFKLYLYIKVKLKLTFKSAG